MLFHLDTEMIPDESTARRMDRKESLLQHLGPPISAILPKDCDVIILDMANGSFCRGVDLDIMEMNNPALMPAPQAPQNPHVPSGTPLQRFVISIRASLESTFPPAFL